MSRWLESRSPDFKSKIPHSTTHKNPWMRMKMILINSLLLISLPFLQYTMTRGNKKSLMSLFPLVVGLLMTDPLTVFASTFEDDIHGAVQQLRHSSSSRMISGKEGTQHQRDSDFGNLLRNWITPSSPQIQRFFSTDVHTSTNTFSVGNQNPLQGRRRRLVEELSTQQLLDLVEESFSMATNGTNYAVLATIVVSEALGEPLPEDLVNRRKRTRHLMTDVEAWIDQQEQYQVMNNPEQVDALLGTVGGLLKECANLEEEILKTLTDEVVETYQNGIASNNGGSRRILRQRRQQQIKLPDGLIQDDFNIFEALYRALSLMQDVIPILFSILRLLSTAVTLIIGQVMVDRSDNRRLGLAVIQDLDKRYRQMHPLLLRLAQHGEDDGNTILLNWMASQAEESFEWQSRRLKPNSPKEPEPELTPDEILELLMEQVEEGRVYIEKSLILIFQTALTLAQFIGFILWGPWGNNK